MVACGFLKLNIIPFLLIVFFYNFQFVCFCVDPIEKKYLQFLFVQMEGRWGVDNDRWLRGRLIVLFTRRGGAVRLVALHTTGQLLFYKLRIVNTRVKFNFF